MTTKSYQDDKAILIRLLEYCKYIYEEEHQRTNRLNNAVKIYLTFLTITLGIGILKIVPLAEIKNLLKSVSSLNPIGPYLELIALSLFYLSAILFGFSFIFTILVLKIWRFERLCDPKDTALKSISLGSENQLLSLITADYTVAANRNYLINEKKARLLSRALFCLISALLIFATTWFALKTFPVLGGNAL